MATRGTHWCAEEREILRQTNTLALEWIILSGKNWSCKYVQLEMQNCRLAWADVTTTRMTEAHR